MPHASKFQEHIKAVISKDGHYCARLIGGWIFLSPIELRAMYQSYIYWPIQIKASFPFCSGNNFLGMLGIQGGLFQIGLCHDMIFFCCVPPLSLIWKSPPENTKAMKSALLNLWRHFLSPPENEKAILMPPWILRRKTERRIHSKTAIFNRAIQGGLAH